MMPDSQRQKLNAQRLLLISPSIRPRVAAVISEMEATGHRPLIDSNVWRSPQEQLRMVARGVSKARWGFHCATTPDGHPDSLAADIVDADLGWNAPRTYWIALGAAAKRAGLNWGGYFGIYGAAHAALDQALLSHNPSTKIALGWDPSHVEVAGITMTAARMGRRPAPPAAAPGKLVPWPVEKKNDSPKPTGAEATLAPAPVPQPAKPPAEHTTAPAAPSEAKPEPSLLDEVPVNETTKALAGKVATKAGARAGGYLTGLWAAMLAGNVAAILGVIFVVGLVATVLYIERKNIARAARYCLRRLKGQD
jgi:cell division septation protein DedD